MKQQRIVSLDLIRTIAILLVIMQHAWSGLQLDDPVAGDVSYMYHALVVIGVPLFFMLSGALMLGAHPLPIRDFLSRRFKRLLLPYLLWATVIYVISVITHKYSEVQTPTDAIYYYLPYLTSGKINASYWYIFVLIGLYLLTPFIQRALSSSQAKSVTQYGLALWWTWIILRTYFPQFGTMHYYNASAFMYMGFFLCGHYCVHYHTDEQINRRIGSIGFVLAYALNVWCLHKGYNSSLPHTIAVISLFLLLKSLAGTQRSETFITSSGRYAYVIYFVHVPIVAALCMLDVWNWCPLWTRPIVITLAAFTISYLAAWIFDRLHFIPNSWIGI